MVDYIKYTPEMANNWSRAYIETHRERPWAFQRLVDASTTSQLESKFWLTEELSNVNDLKYLNKFVVLLLGSILFENIQLSASESLFLSILSKSSISFK